jgi:uncharacterized protein YidB (DUF937 family)
VHQVKEVSVLEWCELSAMVGMLTGRRLVDRPTEVLTAGSASVVDASGTVRDRLSEELETSYFSLVDSQLRDEPLGFDFRGFVSVESKKGISANQMKTHA